MTTDRKATPWNDEGVKTADLPPKTARDLIAATVSQKPTEAQIDYQAAYQREVEGKVATEKLTDDQQILSEQSVESDEAFDFPSVFEHQSADKQVPQVQLPTTSTANHLLDPATLNQENLLKHMAKISDERSQIRQKMLANQEAIDKARKLEIENQALEEEYKRQDEMFQKLQHFHNLFDELRDYLK